MPDAPQLATVVHEGVEVASYSQTADELRAALGMEAQAPTPPEPPKPNGPPPEPPIGDEPEPEPGKEPSPESDAGKALARKRSSLQARINELTREKFESARERDDARNHARRLEQELADLRRGPSAANGNGKPDVSHSPREPERFPKYAEYLTTHPDAELEDWLEARDTWREQASQRRTAEQQQQQARDAQARSHDERAKHVHAAIATAVQQDSEFLSKIDPRLLSTTALSKLEPHDRPTFGNFLVEQIFKSEHPTRLMLHLSNEQEVSRLAQLDPDRVIRELARIEYDLNGATSRPAVPATSTSHAKPPVKPLGGSPPVDADEPPGDDASDDEHLAYYNRKELARQRRRG